MDNYKETFDWIHNIVNAGEQFKSDAILNILTSHNNVSKTIRFKDVFPISLSGVEFKRKNKLIIEESIRRLKKTFINWNSFYWKFKIYSIR